MSKIWTDSRHACRCSGRRSSRNMAIVETSDLSSWGNTLPSGLLQRKSYLPVRKSAGHLARPWENASSLLEEERNPVSIPHRDGGPILSCDDTGEYAPAPKAVGDEAQ